MSAHDLSPLWLVARFGPTVGRAQDAAFVRADDETEAARLGAWEIEAMDDDGSMEDIDSVYVVRVTDATWWRTIPDYVAQRAELQCCGGSQYTEDGHTGHCREKP